MPDPVHVPPPPPGLRPPADGGGPWTLAVPDVPDEHLPLLFHRAHRNLPAGAGLTLDLARPVAPDRLDDLVEGAGWGPVPGGAPHTPVRRAVVRLPTLADSVGPGMRLLVCGINPSPYSAEVGVGYGRPGNRFWPAALAAGVVPVDRDPVAALAGGLGMTDFAKRATPRAAEVTRDEFERGFARVSRLVAWLRPGSVCFVGLGGWRTVVDRTAVAGPQPVAVGGRPVYVMPSTSGLNARTPPAELARHLVAAWALGA